MNMNNVIIYFLSIILSLAFSYYNITYGIILLIYFNNFINILINYDIIL